MLVLGCQTDFNKEGADMKKPIIFCVFLSFSSLAYCANNIIYIVEPEIFVAGDVWLQGKDGKQYAKAQLSEKKLVANVSHVTLGSKYNIKIGFDSGNSMAINSSYDTIVFTPKDGLTYIIVICANNNFTKVFEATPEFLACDSHILDVWEPGDYFTASRDGKAATIVNIKDGVSSDVIPNEPYEKYNLVGINAGTWNIVARPLFSESSFEIKDSFGDPADFIIKNGMWYLLQHGFECDTFSSHPFKLTAIGSTEK